MPLGVGVLVDCLIHSIHMHPQLQQSIVLDTYVHGPQRLHRSARLAQKSGLACGKLVLESRESAQMLPLAFQLLLIAGNH